MTPKSGKAGSPVSPAEAKKADEADDADPGKMAEVKAKQIEAKKGKYNPVKVQPHKPPADAKGGDSSTSTAEEKKSWIEIELIDDEKRPVPGARYSITLPDDTVAEGTLDEKGFARIDGITPGNCKITFPDYDEQCWKAAGGGAGGGTKSGGGASGGKSAGGGGGGSGGGGGKTGAGGGGAKSGGGGAGGTGDAKTF